MRSFQIRCNTQRSSGLQYAHFTSCYKFLKNKNEIFEAHNSFTHVLLLVGHKNADRLRYA